MKGVRKAQRQASFSTAANISLPPRFTVAHLLVEERFMKRAAAAEVNMKRRNDEP
jgi:hypothetical protein